MYLNIILFLGIKIIVQKLTRNNGSSPLYMEANEH
jgi:hypothetical protein